MPNVFLAKINVTLRKSILDPQGKAVHHALSSLGIGQVQDVRIGKHIELRVDASTIAEAEQAAHEACKKLLANPVMEDYTFSVEKV